MATASASWFLRDYALELPRRFRTFLWVFTGMFSAASLAIAFLGYTWFGASDQPSSNFVAAVVSGGLFWLASTLKFGAVEA